VLIWCERKVLLADWLTSQQNRANILKDWDMNFYCSRIDKELFATRLGWSGTQEGNKERTLDVHNKE